MYFHAVCSIPSAFFLRHYRPSVFIQRYKRVFLFLTQPNHRFSPSSYPLPILVRSCKLRLRPPNRFAHPMKEVEVEVVYDKIVVSISK